MKWIKRCGLATVILLLVLVVVLWLIPHGPDEPQGLRVEVLDVGQSDCVLVRFGKRVMMIDTGTVTERESVRAALRTRNIKSIDYLVLTHPHEDHLGNARMILESYTVSLLLLSHAEEAGTDQHLAVEAAARQGVACRRAETGEILAFGDAQIEILYAPREVESVNDAGLILRVTYGETAVLFTGDAEEQGEAALLSAVSAEKLRCDLLKAGHHGSDTSTGEGLLSVALPQYAAISCGRENTYGFPHEALLSRLKARGIACHRTDLQGDLIYESDGKTLKFLNEEKGES